MSTTSPLCVQQRVALWDGAFVRIRAYMRAQGLLEVSTRTRVAAPAIEAHIDVLPCRGQFMATSPEVEMKRLLAGASGSIFQLAHVFRAGEVGPRHREEFHLLEWYRVAREATQAGAQVAFEALATDVERLCEEMAELVTELGPGPGLGLGLGDEAAACPMPRTGDWDRISFDEMWDRTCGGPLPEGPVALRDAIASVSAGEGAALDALDAVEDPQLELLALWSELFSWWSDCALEPWLLQPQRRGRGLHLVDFPAQLCSLAELGPTGASSASASQAASVSISAPVRIRARRFESYVGAVELANGYLELRDEREQRTRFERANALRALEGQAALPISDDFCRAVGQLPPCAGIAMGFERLLGASLGTTQLSDILVHEAPELV